MRGMVMMAMGEGGRGWETDRCWECGSVCDRGWVNKSPSGRGSLVGFGVRKGVESEKARSSSYPPQRYRISSVGCRRSLAFHLSAACLPKVVPNFVVKGEVGKEWGRA
jgi:hypothetical protein